jgi:hypothetical protein
MLASAAVCLMAINCSAEAQMLDLVYPAPGCLERLPTYRSLAAVCRPLNEEQACVSNLACSWSKSINCIPRRGSYVPAPEPTPAELARFGQNPMPDYIEMEPLSYHVQKGNTFVETGPGAIFRRASSLREKRLFDRAIAEYSTILLTEADSPPVLFQRALTYEMKGDKAGAIRDYCRLLIVYTPHARRAAALERIVQLTSATTASAPSSTTPPSADLKPVNPPRTSTIESGRTRQRIAPLSIISESGTNYVIKFANVSDERDQVMIFVRGGETYQTKIALGTYHVRGAAGETWYGKRDLFGPDTQFFKLRGKDGTQQTLRFWQQGRTITGVTLNFQKVVGGNMEQEKISREEFDR